MWKKCGNDSDSDGSVNMQTLYTKYNRKKI